MVLSALHSGRSATSPDYQQEPFGQANPFEQISDAALFAMNPTPRCPVVLLLDTSGSMSGRPIAELNAGIMLLKDELAADPMAAKTVELALVTFGPVEVTNEFQGVQAFQPPSLASSGDTPMGAAILKGLELVRERKNTYQTHGIAYYMPWVFLVTDGGPTDKWRDAATQVRSGEANKSFTFFSVGVDGADFDTLREIGTGDPLKLDGLRFRDLFKWLSSSLSRVSTSTPGDPVKLDNPTGPQGWAVIP